MKEILMCVGMPRSGTTWVAKIIDSHPDILYCHEPDSVYPLKNVPLLVENIESNQVHDIQKLLQGLPYRHEKCLGKTPFFRKSYRGFFAEKAFQASLVLSKLINKNVIISPKKYAQLDNTQIFFKSIESMGRIKLLLSADKMLKIVFIVRSVFGQINSVIKGSQSGEFDCNNLLSLTESELTHLYEVHNERNIDSLEAVLNYSAIEQLAYKWLVYNEKAITEALDFPERVKVISYDAMCDQPESYAASLFDFYGLDYSEQSRDFISKSTSSHSTSFYSVNKNPQEAKNRWQKNISEEDVSKINRIIAGSQSELIMNTTTGLS